jgi:hypothetical protein
MSKKSFNLTVVKKPRDEPIQDKPINFPPLENLHLELLENKKKVKPGAPDTQSQKKRPVPIIKKEEVQTSKIKEEFKKDKSPPLKKEIIKKDPIKKPPEIKKPKDEIPEEDLILEEIIDDDPITENKETDGISEDIIDEEEEIEDDEEIEEDEEEIEDLVEDENVESSEKTVAKKEEEEEVPDPTDIYAGLSPEEREKKEKEEYIWRFRILRKKYKNPSVEIPDFNEHSELLDMKSAYERTTKELFLDSTVESYKSYLIGGFMLTEFICTNWAGVDLSGFTSSQTKMMYKYDMLLIELGEKSYSSWGSNLPVEVRLAGLIIFQAGLFYLGKVITANYGGSMADLFKGMTGQPSETIKDEPSKKKMKGPKFKAEDIRNMANVKAKED